MTTFTLDTRTWAYEQFAGCQRLKRNRESEIWGKVIDQVGRPAEGVQIVHVMDRGADNFEVYCHCLEQRTDWSVCQTPQPRSDSDRSWACHSVPVVPL